MFREIDVAFLRRFERKILVDLPKPKDRVLIIQHFLPESQNWTSDEKNELSEITVGLTGADIKIACKAASLKKIQKAIDVRKGNLILRILTNIIRALFESIVFSMFSTNYLFQAI